MVSKRRSVSKMAAAAAAAAWKYEKEGVDIDKIAICAVVAAHGTSPDNAPAFAAEAARVAEADGVLCTMIAAGVAAAAVGWGFDVVQDVAGAVFDAFKTAKDGRGTRTSTVAERVAEAVNNVSSRYPAVEAAAAAAYAAYYCSDGTVKDGAAIAAANAAGKAANSIKGPAGARAGKNANCVDGRNCLSYAAQVAARAAASRGAVERSAVAAAIKAATPTSTTSQGQQPAGPDSQSESGEEHVTAALITDGPPACKVDHSERGENAATAIASAVACLDWAHTSASLDACGKEWLEAIPKSHDLTFQKLQTVMALDTFLAGFLLFSLTGGESDNPPDKEVVQTILQAFSFTMFLAATMSAAVYMVVTGDTYVLANTDMFSPTLLSAMGFLLLLVTVGDAIFLELGGGIHAGDDHYALFWTTISVGGVLQLIGVLSGIFSVRAENSVPTRSTLEASEYNCCRAFFPCFHAFKACICRKGKGQARV